MINLIDKSNEHVVDSRCLRKAHRAKKATLKKQCFENMSYVLHENKTTMFLMYVDKIPNETRPNKTQLVGLFSPAQIPN